MRERALPGVNRISGKGCLAMLISVIMPVYNAERYVREAVESALAQPETGEVVLVEDGSPDKSLQVCRELSRRFAKVRLVRHGDGRNHGAGASRNLGIKNARFDYVAFLDADDFFLPGRFSVPVRIFETNPDVDGVYEAVGVHFENEAAEQRWRKQTSKMLTTMTEPVPPERLFEAQSPVGRSGYWHIDGWVVKGSVFGRTGLFDEHLRLHQDTAMFIKASAVGRMVPGRLDEPVAMRRVHDHNRISAPRPDAEVHRNHVLMWATLWKWSKRNLNETRQQILLRRFIECAARAYDNRNSRLISRFQSIGQLTLLLLQYPELGVEILFWKEYVANFQPHTLMRIASSFLQRD